MVKSLAAADDGQIRQQPIFWATRWRKSPSPGVGIESSNAEVRNRL
jgi:hypothetical protein